MGKRKEGEAEVGPAATSRKKFTPSFSLCPETRNYGNLSFAEVHAISRACLPACRPHCQRLEPVPRPVGRKQSELAEEEEEEEEEACSSADGRAGSLPSGRGLLRPAEDRRRRRQQAAARRGRLGGGQSRELIGKVSGD